MPYDRNAPNGQESPAAQTAQVRTNFSEFQNVFDNNHTALNNIKQGDHEAIIFKKQTVDLGVTNTLDVLFCKDATSHLGTQPQLFLQIPKFLPKLPDTTDAPNTPMQLTYNTVNTAGPVYQSFLAGGYLIYFGTDSGNYVLNTNIADTIILSPAPTRILMAIAIPNNMTTVGTPIPNLVSTEINTITNDRFIIHSNFLGNTAGNPYSFTWIAVATV